MEKNLQIILDRELHTHSQKNIKIVCRGGVVGPIVKDVWQSGSYIKGPNLNRSEVLTKSYVVIISTKYVKPNKKLENMMTLLWLLIQEFWDEAKAHIETDKPTEW